MKKLSESHLLLWPLSGWGAAVGGRGWLGQQRLMWPLKPSPQWWLVISPHPLFRFYLHDGDDPQPPSTPTTQKTANSSRIKDMIAVGCSVDVTLHMKHLQWFFFCLFFLFLKLHLYCKHTHIYSALEYVSFHTFVKLFF